MTSDTARTAELGRKLVADALQARGAEVTEVKIGRIPVLRTYLPSEARTVDIRVRIRKSGTWQPSIRDGDPDRKPAGETFWVFVDVARGTADPTFYVIPDEWLRQDIGREHQAYLDSHSGERPVSPNSIHHKIKPERISQWRSRWDLLGL